MNTNLSNQTIRKLTSTITETIQTKFMDAVTDAGFNSDDVEQILSCRNLQSAQATIKRILDGQEPEASEEPVIAIKSKSKATKKKYKKRPTINGTQVADYGKIINALRDGATANDVQTLAGWKSSPHKRMAVIANRYGCRLDRQGKVYTAVPIAG